MPDVLIRNLPDELLNALKSQAHLHRRSVQKELHAIIANAVQAKPLEQKIDLILSTAKPQTECSWDRESIYSDDITVL